jgi:ribosomal protein L37AE/L43A
VANENITSQRHYTAPCPGCGAPVEFRSAQSTHAVCGYCQSTVVRSGEVLSRVGKMAELFDDHSPLQLFATGQFAKRNFTLIGRLQFKTDEGSWTEWNALFDDGQSGWLAEDNGAYVFTFPSDNQRELPAAERFALGATTTINGKAYSVASNVRAMLISAQGELPKLPPLGQAFAVVELRGDAEVLSFDYGTQPPTVSKGSAVLLEDLQLKGLKDESVKEEKGQQFNCPNCGAPVTVALQTSKSITCGSCNSLIDLSQGLGGALKSAMQDEPINPLIPLGTLGQLQGVQWQVVGFQHRMGVAKGDDEHFGWSEYLLYNQKRGFCFLVDSEEGWSLVRPTTGAPRMASSSAQKASYMGTDYQLKYSYSAETNYVCGEFYWLVQRGQTTQNRDFANGRRLLSLEQSGSELVWSSGDQMSSDTVAKAFGLQDKKDLLKRGDVAPFSAAPSMSVGTIIVVVIVLVLLSALFSRCSSCDPSVENCSSSSRSSGGSFGGFSGGGGHK